MGLQDTVSVSTTSETVGTAPSVAELARGYVDGSLDPEEAVGQLFDRIDRVESRLGAWQDLYRSDAEAAATAAKLAIESGHRIGPFHGIPFALKDIVHLEGRITTAGCMALRDRVSTSTAEIARRLIAAGGIVIGKTKTVEFALGGWGTNELMGTPRNPWDPEVARAPGGSSSGSAVAVATGMAPCAIGTDTGGSVRLPASLCGIVGLKTTEGLLPTSGIEPLSHTFDTPGPIARTVEDAALMFDVLTGRGAIDIDDDWQAGRGFYRGLRRGVRGLRLGVLGLSARSPVEPEVLEAYDRSLDLLADRGAEITVFEPPRPFEEMLEATFVIVTAEAWHHHGSLFADDDVPLDRHVRARGLPGRDLTASAYIAALETRDRHRIEFLASLDPLDGLLTPTTPMVAPPVEGIDEGTTPAHFTRAGNYLGLCGLSVPMPLGSSGLPTGLQVLARGNAEALVLQVGAAFESARGPLPEPPGA